MQVTLNHLPVIQPQAEAGNFRVLATSGTTRAQAMPGVPTLKESGYDIVASAWFGLFAPAKTPQKYSINSLRRSPTPQRTPPLSRSSAQGDEIRVEGPDSFLALQKSELKKWKIVIEKAGIVLN